MWTREFQEVNQTILARSGIATKTLHQKLEGAVAKKAPAEYRKIDAAMRQLDYSEMIATN